jgi:DnaJ-class molecular chaperone
MSKDVCSTCGGSGEVPCPACSHLSSQTVKKRGRELREWESCAACQGRQIIKCPDCRGTGKSK